MLRNLSFLGLYIAASLLVGCGSGGDTTPTATTQQKPDTTQQEITIAVIPKGTTHPYWKSVHAGAQAAADELGVKIIWKGPLMENDRAQEIGIVEQFVSDGVSGIVLAPLDSTALVRPVGSAKDKNIPVVIIDSALKAEPGKDFTSFVATNNKLGGSLGGEELARLIDNKGKVVLLRYAEGSASTEEREAGFLEAIAKHPDIQVTVKDRYGNPTSAEAQTTAMNIIDQIKDADGVFCPNESTTFGMLLALRQNNLAGQKKFVGFDTSKELMEALQKGEINALVAQDPKKMGYEGVKTCVAAIKGEKVEPTIDSGCKLITKENLEDPAVKKMLQIEQYLQPEADMSIPTDPGTPGLLRMEGVHKRFGATKALGGVDLHVRAGEVLALVGENGAGKSTLMKVLAGAHAADEGRMWLEGKPYQPRNPLDSRRAGVCMIYQELALAPHLTVMENILLGMEPVKGPFMRWGEVRRIAANAMAQLGRSDIRPETIVQNLSIAEQQLVEIARAIAVGCKVLVLDEPTSSLTRSDIDHLFNLVHRLKKQGLGIIYISHFLEEVRELSDRVTVLRDGKSVGEGPTAMTPNDRIIAMMVGRPVEDLYPRSQRAPGQAVLEINDLAGPLKPTQASLTLHRGEVLGIAGLVGAGRTELFRAIFGLDSIKHGTLKVGTYVGPASPARHWAHGMGLVSEDRKTEGLALTLSIADNTTLSCLSSLVFPSRQDASSRRWIDRLSIKCRSPRQAVGNLSGGNQQKVAIARLLEHQVDVLLLDEPTRGIDVGAKAQIYRLIDELACQGKAVLMISSYLPELLGTCDRIAVMCKGKLGPARLVSQTNEHQIMMEATGTGESK